MHILLRLSITALLVASSRAGTNALSPPDTRNAAVRQAFRELERPIEYILLRQGDSHGPMSFISLQGGASAFARRYSAAELVYALWPLLDSPEDDADAALILMGKLNVTLYTDSFTYRQPSERGNWSAMRTYCVETCRIYARRALGQPEWWYPHPVLFDRGRVLAESKTNAVVRATHIEAMVKALADPKIRTENPLEVNNILLILDALKAREAVQTFVDYMFYDWRTASDYRLKIGEAPSRHSSTTEAEHYERTTIGGIVQSPLPCIHILPNLGSDYVPLALRRIANSTPEERAVYEGGGAVTACALYYFIFLRFTEKQALDAITDYQDKEEDLSQEQKDALGELAEAIRGKKFRTDGLLKNSNPVVRTWAPSYTNAPPINKP